MKVPRTDIHNERLLFFSCRGPSVISVACERHNRGFMSVTMSQDRCFTHTRIPEVTLFKEVGYVLND